MAAPNGHGTTEQPPDEFHEDLDALAPAARHTITFQKTRYTVRHVLDLPLGDWMALLRLEEQWQAANTAGDTAGALGLLQQRLVLLIPEMPPEVIQRLTYPQALRASAAAWAMARKEAGSADPPPAGADSGSSTGSPASAVSTVGGRATG